MTDPLATRVRQALTVDDQLDDVRRARLWTRIDAELASSRDLARSHRRSLRTGIAIGALAAAAVCALAVGVIGRGPPDHKPTIASAPPPLLEAAAETTVSARLGAHAQVQLVGPARLERVPGSASGRDTVVRLPRGRLITSFEGGAGRRFRIETPDASVEVIGTEFVVDVAQRTCVEVRHGRVQLSDHGRVRLVTAGMRTCAEPAPVPMPVPESAPRTAVAEPLPPARRIEPEPEPEPEPDLPRPAPTPPPAPPAPAPPAAPTSASDLYTRAERALAAGDPRAADAALAALLAAHPHSPLADQALYDRARIAYQQRNFPAARHQLDQLITREGALAEPGEYLRCRIAVQQREPTAAQCLAAYRRRHPGSPHDLDVRALEVQLAHAAGGCARARALLADLGRVHPGAPLTTAWQARCP